MLASNYFHHRITIMGRCEYCHAVNKRGSGRTFHRFPRSDLYQLEKWVENFGRPNWRPRSDSLLCSAHFEECCFDRTGFLVRLQKDSVPTIFEEVAHLCISCKCAKFSSKDRTFHKFPTKDPELLEQWVKNINVEALDIEQSLICSAHFETSCFRKVKGYWILKKGSIPTLFGTNSRIACNKRKEIRRTEDRSANGTIIGSSRRVKLSDFSHPKQWKLYEHNETNINAHDITATETFTSVIRNCSLLPVLIEPNDNRMKAGGSEIRGEKEKALLCISATRVNNSFDFLNNDGLKTPEQSPPPVTLSTRECKRILNHDHQYYDSPETLRKKLQKARKALCEKQKITRVQNQHIKRMQQQISSLKEVISELKKKSLSITVDKK